MLVQFTPWAFAAVTVKFLVYLGSFFAIGSALFILFNPGIHVRLIRALSAIVILGTVVAAIASLIQFYVQAGTLLDEGFMGMFDSEMIELVRNSPMGTSVFIRCLGLILLLSLVLSIPVAKLFGFLGAVMTAGSFAFIGHTTREPQWILMLLVTIHVLAVSFWVGGLWPLRRVARGAIPLHQAAAMARRFGRQAVFVVGALVLVGAAMLYLLVGSWRELITSAYGLALLVKLLLIYGILRLAAMNKLKIVPRMLDGDDTAATDLVNSIDRETWLIILVLFVTAALTTVPLPTGS